MNTETAQRRLLEAMARVQNTPNLDHGDTDSPLSSVALGLRSLALQLAPAGREESAMALIYGAVANLAQAVANDMKEAAHNG